MHCHFWRIPVWIMVDHDEIIHCATHQQLVNKLMNRMAENGKVALNMQLYANSAAQKSMAALDLAIARRAIRRLNFI